MIREGHEVNKFYILTAGRACLLQDDQVIGSIRNGEHFGSIPIHLNQISGSPFKSAYSVRTLEWTEVRSLSISIFRQLIGQFPDAKGILVQRIADNLYDQQSKQAEEQNVKGNEKSVSAADVASKQVSSPENPLSSLANVELCGNSTL